jgi:hypothetical protein
LASVRLPDPLPDAAAVADHHFSDVPGKPPIPRAQRRTLEDTPPNGLMGVPGSDGSSRERASKDAAGAAGGGGGGRSVDGLLGPRLVRVASRSRQAKDSLDAV